MANAPYGGSVAQVASNQIAMSAQERASQEAMVTRLLNQLQQKRGNERQDRLDIQDQANVDREHQLRRESFDTRTQLDKDATAERGRQFDENLKLNREYLDIAKTNPTATSLKAQQDILALAAEEADNGIFDPVNYKTLSTEQSSALMRRRDLARKSIEAEHSQISDYANARNRISKLRGYVGLSTEARKDAPNAPREFQKSPTYATALGIAKANGVPIGFLPDPVDPKAPTRQDIDSRILDWTTEANAMQPQVDAMGKSRAGTGGSFADRVTQDPATGTFRPAFSLPWATTPGTNAPAKVRVMKDGKQFWLPSTQLQEAETQGYQLVPQQ